MPATFTQRFQLRFDECAPDGTARAGAILRYVVETAFGHSAHEGFPLAWYETHGLFWLVRRAHLELQRPMPYSTIFDITTEVLGFRRIWARRRNTVRDASGETLAVVTMDWIFTDRTGSPARVVPEMAAAFPSLSARMEIDRLELGDPPIGLQPLEYIVLAHQVDPRGHMNSAAYLDLFEDALPGAGADPQHRPSVYELEYLRAALPGDRLHLLVWRPDDGWAMVASARDGLAVVRVRRREGPDAP